MDRDVFWLDVNALINMALRRCDPEWSEPCSKPECRCSRAMNKYVMSRSLNPPVAIELPPMLELILSSWRGPMIDTQALACYIILARDIELKLFKAGEGVGDVFNLNKVTTDLHSYTLEIVNCAPRKGKRKNQKRAQIKMSQKFMQKHTSIRRRGLNALVSIWKTLKESPRWDAEMPKPAVKSAASKEPDRELNEIEKQEKEAEEAYLASVKKATGVGLEGQLEMAGYSQSTIETVKAEMEASKAAGAAEEMAKLPPTLEENADSDSDTSSYVIEDAALSENEAPKEAPKEEEPKLVEEPAKDKKEDQEESRRKDILSHFREIEPLLGKMMALLDAVEVQLQECPDDPVNESKAKDDAIHFYNKYYRPFLSLCLTPYTQGRCLAHNEEGLRANHREMLAWYEKEFRQGVEETLHA